MKEKKYFSVSDQAEKYEKSGCAFSGSGNHPDDYLHFLSNCRYIYHQYLSVERNFSRQNLYRYPELDYPSAGQKLLDCL